MIKLTVSDVTSRLKNFISDRRLWWSLLSVAVMGLIAFVYFSPDAQEGNVLRQYDVKQGIAVGQEAKAYAEATGETARWTNSLFSGMPTFQISPDYPSNHLFNWINTVMGLGLPSPANLLTMMMIGFFILGLAMKMRWWVALIAAIGYGFSSYFIILIGAGHIWKFITLAYIPPTIAGIVLCYRGRYLAGSALAALFAMMQIASNHVQMTYYFLFVILGFMVAYFCSMFKENKLKQWWIATGCLAVAGTLAVTANLPGLYNTYEYSKETMRGGHSELTQETDASQATTGLNRDYITQYSYMPSETFSLLIPNIKGGANVKPEKGSMTMLTLADLPEAQEMAQKGSIDQMEAQYLQYMSQYFGDPEGTNGPVYVGALIFALFLLGIVIVRGPMKWVLAVLTILSILLAWGRHLMGLTDLFIDYMPMYSKFRTVESILVIAEFTMPLLAAMALQKIFSAKTDEEVARLRKPLLWSFGIALFFCLVGIIYPEAYGSTISDNDRYIDSMIQQQLSEAGYPADAAAQLSLQSPRIYNAVTELRNSLVEDDAMRSFMIVGAGFLIILLFLRRKVSVAVGAVAIGIIICGDLFMVNKRYLDHNSFVAKRMTVGPPIEMTDADRMILADTTTHYRVMNLPLFNSADPSYYHKMIGGYHAAKLTRYQDLIDRHLASFTQGEPTDADWRVLNMLNARWIVGFDGQPLQNPEAMGNAWFVDSVNYVTDADNEMAALDAIDPRHTAVADKNFHGALGEIQAAAPSDTIRLTSYAPNRLTYHAETARDGVAVFSEVYFPWGWHATVDGKETPLARVNYVLRAMRIPAGSHTIEMWFDPQSLHVTDTWARVAIILIYIALGASLVVNVLRKKED